VLGSERKVGVFEEEVEELEKFSGDSGEGEFGGFSAFAEAEVEGAKDGVVASGGESGHVEGAAEAKAAALDVARLAQVTAVVGERSDAEEGGSLIAGESAQFRAESQSGGGGERADADDRSETLELGIEEGIPGDGLLHLGVELEDLASEETQAGLELALDEGQLVGEAGLDLEGALFEDGLLAGDDEGLESELGRGRHRVGLGSKVLAKELQVFGIKRIGLGLLPLAFDEVADLGGIDHRDGPALLVGGADQSAVIRPGRLANELGAGRELGKEPFEPRAVIGENAALFWGEQKVEFRFGEIEADVGGLRGHELEELTVSALILVFANSRDLGGENLPGGHRVPATVRA
jgi:hypothetical protein